MNLQSATSFIKEQQQKMQALHHAIDVLYFDQMAHAPKGSAGDFAATMGLLTADKYRLLVNGEMERALETLQGNLDALDAITAAAVKELSYELKRIRCIPIDEYAAFEVLRNEAEAAWHVAKATNDYPLFGEYLQRIVDTRVRFAQYFDPAADPYDVQCEGFQKGNSARLLDDSFAVFKRDIVPFIKRILEAGREIDDSFLRLHYPIGDQRLLGDYLMDVMTVDKRYCAIAETEHPRTFMFNKHDVRISTHYYPDKLHAALYSTLHEAGHALYALHIGDELNNSVLGEGISMGMHETQSRFFENIVGRSLPFIEFLFPKLQELFPSQFKGVTPEKFHLAVNKINPSCIRMEADELTYSVHIMIRYELEKQMLAGTLLARDLPEAWNALYLECLGVAVPDDARGALQDSHWSHGSFGSFPCYYLGNCYGAQIYDAMQQQLDMPALMRKGTLSPIVEWLAQRIYRHGKRIDVNEALQNCTGQAFDPVYYNRYLIEKFAPVYGIAQS